MKLKAPLLLVAGAVLVNVLYSGVGVETVKSHSEQSRATEFATLVQQINRNTDVQDHTIQTVVAERDDIKYFADLGVVYTIGDSLWMDGQNISDSGVIHTFPLVNDSGGTVEVTSVRTSCACAKACMSSSTLAPGGKTIISLSVSHDKLSRGPKSFWVFLTTDTAGVWKCGVRSQIERAVEWPAESIPFGSIVGDQSVVRKIDLVLSRPPFIRDLTYVGCQSSTPHVKVISVAKDTSVIKPDVERTVVTLSAGLSVPAEQPCQVYDAYLTAIYESAGVEHESQVRLTFEKRTSFEVSPKRIVLPRVQRNDEGIALTVGHRDGVKFRILSISAPDSLQLDLPTPTSSAQSHHINLMVVPGAARHASVEELVIATDVLHEKILSIPLVSLPIRR